LAVLRFTLDRHLYHHLSDSKTGLNAPALAVLTGLDRLGSHVVPGDDPEKPRTGTAWWSCT
jgi:hypothetical protein